MPKFYPAITLLLRRLLLVLFLICTGCTSLLESSKYRFSEGIYRAKISRAPATRVYVDKAKDTLVLYPTHDYQRGQTVRLDTNRKIILTIPDELYTAPGSHYIFSKPTIDLDVLTIPFKYRPAAAGIPQQLSTTFQGALFLGTRRDIYLYRYRRTPVGNYKKFLNHFGYSVGLFSGIGATTVNQVFTGGKLGYEYQGVVLLNGLAVNIGVNKFTIGLALGFDHLMDRYRHDWIYQHKPWVGLAFGLNLY